MSPPEGVQARADHDPGALGAFGDFAFDADLDAAEEFLHDFRSHQQLFRLALGKTAGLLAADGAQSAFQVAHAGFASVVPDHVQNGVFRKFNLLFGDPVFFDLPRDQVLECDVYLLFFGVTLEFDDLHAVAQRLGDGIEHVGGGNEQHLGEVERNVQVVVAESRSSARDRGPRARRSRDRRENRGRPCRSRRA